ncbi:DUF5134 domain-containing protein [Streptomyces scopuliridis]|nr:DUF5134 domain-containing protein [Streptomyces scopuliridis]WSB37221.1 DUF5134 domain-containing protein [Streptomyces scopuliridis]WSC01843.1 DUF5134 domain-containing protein [Streptomyces scopuliridis]WSC04620.1 DUF5134 domain-containing protein [Streptomyces scopuliridis]
MHGPAMSGWLLVALCAAAGSYCLLRLRDSVGAQRGSVGGEALMGFGMAAMAVPAAVLTPPRWVWVGYVVVFAGAALHTLLRAGGSGHRLHHLLGMLAMVYMAGAMALAPAGAHSAHTAGSGSGAPLITGVLLVYYAGYVLWAGARLLPVPATAGPEGGRGTALAGWGERPELALVCRLSMGIAMLAMLLTL